MKTEYVEMTEEKFLEIYTSEKFRNEVAFAHQCCDREMKFLYYGTCSYPVRYKVTEAQIAKAKAELQQAKAEVYKKHGNDLLFVGMGSEYVPRFWGDVCNYRIRTEFTNKDGHQYFIEFCRVAKGDGFVITFAIDRDKEIELNRDWKRQGEYYHYKGLTYKNLDLLYTKDNILRLVNKQFECLFRNIVIDNYNIHPDDREIICKSPKQ